MNRRNLLKSIGFTGMAAILPFSGMKLMASPACDPTSPDIQGPFYLPNQPFQSKIAPDAAPGTILFITGTVYGKDCQTPLQNALVDVWQANDGGQYENNDYRGRMYTDAAGNYAYQTILPGKYLNGAQYRPRHIHYKVTSPDGSNTLTTQLYFSGDTSIPADPWASDPNAADRIIPLSTDGSGHMHGVLDVNLDVAVSVNEIIKDKGYILNCNPNPFTNNLKINFYLPAPADVSLVVYNILGKEEFKVSHIKKGKGTNSISWDGLNGNGINAAPGIYIVKLFIDDKATDAKRVLRHV